MTSLQEQTICMILKVMEILKRKKIFDDKEIVEVIKECPEVYGGYLNMIYETNRKVENRPEEADGCPEEAET